MKCLSFLFWLLTVLVVSLPAQTVKIRKSEQLQMEVAGYYPQFSPDDGKIYFTSSHYQGIWEYDRQTKVVRMLTNDWSAGYQFQITADGHKIIYRCDNFDQPKKRSAIIALDLQKMSKEIIQPFATEVSPPHLAAGGILFYTVAYRPKMNILKPSKTYELTAMAQPVVTIEEQKMALYINGQKKVLDPFAGGSYFWQSVSPDGKKILFTEAHRGTFICDLDGKIVVALGRAHAPQWSPDGKWICYMDDYDNGYYTMASEIFIIRADGSQRTAITQTPDLIEMYPRWANTTSGSMAFNTVDGKIFLVDLTHDE